MDWRKTLNSIPLDQWSTFQAGAMYGAAMAAAGAADMMLGQAFGGGILNEEAVKDLGDKLRAMDDIPTPPVHTIEVHCCQECPWLTVDEDCVYPEYPFLGNLDEALESVTPPIDCPLEELPTKVILVRLNSRRS